MNLYALGLAFTLVCVLALGLQWQENSKLKQTLRPLRLSVDVRNYITKLALGRSLMIVLLVAACGTMTLSLSWKLNQLQQEQQETLAKLKKTQAALDAKTERLSKKAQRAAALAEKRAEKITPKAAKPVELIAPPTISPTQTSSKASAISDIFDATEENNSSSTTLDTLKKRYESLYVSYLFHLRCERATEADYNLLSKMLRKEMMTLDAPASFESDILDAAKGSHREVYANVECESPEGIKNAAKFREYIDRVHAQDEYP